MKEPYRYYNAYPNAQNNGETWGVNLRWANDHHRDFGGSFQGHQFSRSTAYRIGKQWVDSGIDRAKTE